MERREGEAAAMAAAAAAAAEAQGTDSFLIGSQKVCLSEQFLTCHPSAGDNAEGASLPVAPDGIPVASESAEVTLEYIILETIATAKGEK